MRCAELEFCEYLQTVFPRFPACKAKAFGRSRIAEGIFFQSCAVPPEPSSLEINQQIHVPWQAPDEIGTGGFLEKSP